MTRAAPLLALALLPAGRLVAQLPSAKEMAAARTDVWAEAAIRQPGGPSYEFYRDLLPPLRYCNAAFRHYPLVLCEPAGPVKARWVSNGSGVNLIADKKPMWKELGTPVAFYAGGEAFGSDILRLDGPRYVDGYLPVVRVGYAVGGTTYEQEAFAPTTPGFAGTGAVCVRLTARKNAGRVAARVPAGGEKVVRAGPGWAWDAGKRELSVDLKADQSADLTVDTVPPATPAAVPDYDAERRNCVATWKMLLARGTRFDIPEPIVRNAWRALVVGNALLTNGDRPYYSAGNGYEKLYEAECGDVARAAMLFGYPAEARGMLGPLLDFQRAATRFHVAGHKLQLLAHYYWVTRDADTLRESRPKWEPAVTLIRENRQPDTGLLPKDRYAGDIDGAVLSLNSNAACWRGLRDVAAVLADIGETDRAAALGKDAADYRKAILAAVDKSQRTDAKFIPIALLSDEPAHDPLTATRTGSYYDLMIPYVLGSGVFGPGDPREGWVIDYLRNHGGLAMGMIRSTPHQGEFNRQPGVNVLYGLRYNLALLRRGDRDHALAGFYGQLAQAMTRDTFVGGEGSRFFHGDDHGRSFYLPPNSASNATFLTTLRYLIIQDWDMDDDGKPETLRLLDAIPPRWLTDGATVGVDQAPSAFGGVTVRAEARLKQGEVVVTTAAPHRPVGKWTVRIPNPVGYRVVGATVGGAEVPRDADGRVDLTGRAGAVEVRFRVRAE